MTTGFGPYVATPPAPDTDASGTVYETTLTTSIQTVDIGGVSVQAEVYNGTIPGPTFRLNVGDTVIVRLVNDLPYPTGIHWHGIELQNSADGTPVTQDGARVGPFLKPVPVSPSGGTYLYRFKVPRPGIFWYHPHHFHSTNRVFRGLYGMIVVADPTHESALIPGVIPGPADTMQVVLSDITVCKVPGSNDSETYAGLAGAEWLNPVTTVQSGPSPEDLCELAPLDDDGNAGAPFAAGQVPNIQRASGGLTVEGQTVLTNGFMVAERAGTPASPGALDPSGVYPAAVAQTHPVLAGQALRLQLVNCATTRFFRLVLIDHTQPGNPIIPIVRIGGEGGLLNRAVLEGGTLTDSMGPGTFDTQYNQGELLLPPAARADVVVVIPSTASTGDVLTLWTRDFERIGPGQPHSPWAGLPTVPVMHFNVIGISGSPLTIDGGDGATTGTQLLASIPGESIQPLTPFTADDLLDPSTFVPAKGGFSGTQSQLRDIQLTAGGGVASINNLPGDFSGFNPYTTVPKADSARYAEAGDTLELTINNLTQAHHPFHLHGFSFQPISMTGPGGTYTWPYPEFVDVLNVPSGHQLTIGVHLQDRPLADGMTLGGALGRWLFHCHIFFHAHSGMISELVVTNDLGGAGSEKPNVDVGGSWAYTPSGGTAERRGTFSHPDGDVVSLSASMGTVMDTGGGTWYWSLDSTGLPDDTHYVYIEAEDASGRKDQTVFRLKIGGADDGSDSGDPHIRTVDGTRYDFQGVGEFTLLKDREGMEVQTRQTPVPSARGITDSHSGLKACVSINTAMAARVGSHRISYQPLPSEQGSRLQFFVDGKPTRLTPQGINLDGHRVSAFDADGEVGLRVDYAHQPVLTVTPKFWNKHQVWYMNIAIEHTQADAGLMGPIAPGSWLPALRSGASVGPIPRSLGERYETLYKTFADSWRVNDTSLFVYAPGTSTNTFTDRDWPAEKPPCVVKPQFALPQITPHVTITDVEAHQICAAVTDGDLKANCVFDVAATGDEEFAKGYLFAQRLRRRGTKVQVVADRPTSRLGDPLSVTAIVLPFDKHCRATKGRVSLLVDGVQKGADLSVDAAGRARFDASGLSKGAHTIEAIYTPDITSDEGASLPSKSAYLRHEVLDPKGAPFEPVDARIVLERIEILDDRDLIGKGEIWFDTRVRTSHGTGSEITTRLPAKDHYSVSDQPGKNTIEPDAEIFRGIVADDLTVQVCGGERDWLSRNDPLGIYTRNFCGDPASWIGHYRPDDEPLDEEDVGLFRLTYRIERVS